MNSGLKAPTTVDSTLNQKKYSMTLRFIIIFCFSISLTCYAVIRSGKIGRLSNVPNYDDVVYLASAMDLVYSTNLEGRVGLLAFLKRDGLHSPYSTGLAAVAYKIGGFDNSMPYRANVLVIILYLSAIGYFLRNVGTASFSLILWMFLMLPFATLAVVEFRPDPAWAVVTGFMVVYAITRHDLFVNVKQMVFLGVIAAAALLIKPSTFAMTILVLGAGLASQIILNAVEKGWRKSIVKSITSVCIVLAVTFLAILPYSYFYWRETYDYFYINSFGENAEIWRHHGGIVNQWMYYLVGWGAKSNLGGLFCWFFYPIFFSLAICHISVSSLRDKLGTIFILGTIVIVYAVNSLGNAKTPFLGGVFYGMLLFGTAYWIGQLLPLLWKSNLLINFDIKWKQQVS